MHQVLSNGSQMSGLIGRIEEYKSGYVVCIDYTEP